MELNYLSILRCPAGSRKEGRCLSALSVDETEVPLVFFPNTEGAQDDIMEGALRCGSCGAVYPILCGVAILTGNVGQYLWSDFYSLLGFTAEMGGTVGEIKTLMRRLATAAGPVGPSGEKLPPPFQVYDRVGSTRAAKFLSSYLINHFLGLAGVPVLNDVQRRLARKYLEPGEPHSVLARMLDLSLADDAREPDERGMALDVGCSVGGMTARFSTSTQAAIGIDSNFESLLCARAILKGLPVPRTKIPVFTEGDNRLEQSIEPPDGSRCEFLLAYADALPFADESFQVVASSNLVDVVERPYWVLEENRRLLDRDGLLVLSTPFLYSSPGVTNYLGPVGESPIQMLRGRLDKLGFEVVHEQDDVPWIVYHFRRRIDLYQVLCLTARWKKG